MTGISARTRKSAKMEPTTGIEPVNLFLTKEVLYLLSYVGFSRVQPTRGLEKVQRVKERRSIRQVKARPECSRQSQAQRCSTDDNDSLWPPLSPTCSYLVERGGFEPPKASPADLQSAPFGRSGTSPSKSPLTEPQNPDKLS